MKTYKLNPTFNEFMYALIRLHINKNIIFGLILGLPFPVLLMWQDFYSSGWAFSLEKLGLKLSEHSYHYFFIFLPIITGLVAGVFGSVREKSSRRIKALIEELEKLSNIDSLTTLYTRRYFDSEIAKEFQRASRNNTTFAIAAVDLDKLKALNDTDGHPVGDAVLESIGRIVHENCRLYDVPARLGGDEFSILLPNTTEEHAITVAKRLRDQIDKHDFAEAGISGKTPITISIGVANYPDDGDTIATVMKAADKALYDAKSCGRNCIFDGNGNKV